MSSTTPMRRPHRGELPRRRCRHRFLHSGGGRRQRGRHRGARRHARGRHHRLAGTHRPRAGASVEKNGTGLVWSPNFSIGVNVFFRLVAEAARLLADEPAYGAWAWEIHHSTKKDAPSGTLLKLVDEMKKAGYARNIDVGSNRAGAIPAPTKSASIAGRTPSRCATRPAAAKVRAGRAEGRPMDRWEKGFLRI